MIARRTPFVPPAAFPACAPFSGALKSRHCRIAGPNSFRITLFRKSSHFAPKCSKITPFVSGSFLAPLPQLLWNHTVSQNSVLTPFESHCFILIGLKVPRNHTVSKNRGWGVLWKSPRSCRPTIDYQLSTLDFLPPYLVTSLPLQSPLCSRRCRRYTRARPWSPPCFAPRRRPTESWPRQTPPSSDRTG